MSEQYTVAVYYFPNFHKDPRNESVHGKGWTEWELVRRAEPRFPGHRQPREPLWGYEDEADPEVFSRKIKAASAHGVDVFIFDWYWYDDGGFLKRALETGYLQAPNVDDVRFALMWANHDWMNIHPAKLRTEPVVLHPGDVKPLTFDVLTDYCVETYFRHPAYWRIEGRPYFSIYDTAMLVESLGGLEATREGLEEFRAKVRSAGLPGLHLNAVLWGVEVPAGGEEAGTPAEVVDCLGFDSATSYVWVHDFALEDFPETEYRWALNQATRTWRIDARETPVPYYPNVTAGWDPSPRTVQSDRYEEAGYPFTPVLTGNTPEAFREALERVKRFMDRRRDHPGIFTLNAWNEWTEGSYLEPDTVNDTAYLEALGEVFG